ncbi:MAG TPA: type VI immunity family protein [Candidatus Angelobacter sp.]|nr:type VI immunity family protein [Candidatus Angelobacter sp.]
MPTTYSQGMTVLADLSRRNKLADLDDILFPDAGNRDFAFGVRAEFFFHSFGEIAAKEAMVSLAEAYYRECTPAPNLFVQSDDTRMFENEADIRSILNLSREDPSAGDLKSQFIDPERTLSFYVKWVEKRAKPADPAYQSFECLVDSKSSRDGGLLKYNASFGEVERDPGLYVRRFVERAQTLKVYWAVAGCALLFGYFSRSKLIAAYGLYRRFPGLLHDTFSDLSRAMRRRDDAICAVNWLTAISTNLLDRVGGLANAQKECGTEVQIHPYAGGVVFQAGEKPVLGDVNAGDIPDAYRRVNRLLRPLRFNEYQRSNFIPVPPEVDDAAATQAWISRFD